MEIKKELVIEVTDEVYRLWWKTRTKEGKYKKNRVGAGAKREDVRVKGMVEEVAGYLRKREITGVCNNLNLNDTVVCV